MAIEVLSREEMIVVAGGNSNSIVGELLTIVEGLTNNKLGAALGNILGSVLPLVTGVVGGVLKVLKL